MELSLKVVMGLGALIVALVATIAYLLYDKFAGRTSTSAALADQAPKAINFEVKNSELLIKSPEELKTLVSESDDKGVTVSSGTLNVATVFHVLVILKMPLLNRMARQLSRNMAQLVIR